MRGDAKGGRGVLVHKHLINCQLPTQKDTRFYGVSTLTHINSKLPNTDQTSLPFSRFLQNNRDSQCAINKQAVIDENKGLKTRETRTAKQERIETCHSAGDALAREA